MSDMLPETYGQGYQYEDNTEFTSEVTGGESTDNTATETQEESNGNPAWNEMLSAVPEEFHPHLTDHLTKWDKGVQDRFTKVQQQFAPYKEFAELNVPTQDIQQALQLFQAINTQPRSVYDYLGQQFNFGVEQQQSQGQREEEQVENYDLNDEKFDITKDPRFVEMSEKASRADSFIQQMQEQQRQAEINRSVDAEAEAVKAKYPDLDMKAVATFAVGQSNQTNKMPDLMAAAEYLQSLIPQPRVSDTAPPVVRAGNRGVPQQPAKPFGKMTPDERAAWVISQTG